MTPELIAGFVGVAVSLGLEYIPGFKDWYNALGDTKQKLVALGIGAVIVEGAFGLGCFSLIVAYWPCTWFGEWSAVLAFLAYALANQGFFALFLKKANK